MGKSYNSPASVGSGRQCHDEVVIGEQVALTLASDKGGVEGGDCSDVQQLPAADSNHILIYTTH